MPGPIKAKKSLYTYMQNLNEICEEILSYWSVMEWMDQQTPEGITSYPAGNKNNIKDHTLLLPLKI